MGTKLTTGILGATGAVGQKLLQLLEGHPQFEVRALFASEKSAGKPYREAVNWQAPGSFPESFGDLVVQTCEPGEPLDLVFSALPKEQAGTVEPAFAAAGFAVVSNASAFRMAEDVPLVIPELNPDHIELIRRQQTTRAWSKGFIVTNPNCATIGLAIPLAALDEAFGVDKVNVVTMQARSGAGYPGPSEEEIGDNLLPYIGGEEDKLESEPQKILGRLTGNGIEHAPMTISAACNRVDVSDGHFEAVSLSLRKPASLEEIASALSEYAGKVADLGLHSSPRPLIRVHNEAARPQPKLDRDEGGGMTTHVGRIRTCPILDVKLVILSHNTVRGAAGAALLNGELLVAKGLIG